MKVSIDWLLEWINCPLDAQQLASQLTMAGLEVDAINPVAGKFNEVIVAEVITTYPHPQADKLTLCDLITGNGDNHLRVVCGAANVRKGLKVALAQIGTIMPNGLKIKESKLRGELSQGMLCSASELGLADNSEGILELEPDAPLGEDLRSYLRLDDAVLDIDLTPNRSDCLSMIGIAREVSALMAQPLKTLEKKRIIPQHDEELKITLSNPQACPRYCGRILKNINSDATTPLWLKEKLRRAGIRTIHPVVDVTNYVMLELGQPMHAFDLEKIQGNICVRISSQEEQLALLDGQTIQLTHAPLVISDEKGSMALAGIMGGAETAVSEKTHSIFLESAFFAPRAIAGMARKYGLFTDSSQRFERGVDPNLPRVALERATELLLAICGGEPGPISEVIADEQLPKQPVIHFQPAKVQQLTGIAVTEKEIRRLLESLGMEITAKEDKWEVRPPSYRFDINLDVDLVEEIIRLQGYDKIPGKKMHGLIQSGTIDSTELKIQKAAKVLATRGYHETITYSFVDPQLQQILYPERSSLQLLNPISSELSQMRLGMWPGLLASMIYNMHRQHESIKLFETGVIFQQENQILKEFPCLAGLLTGQKGDLNWCENRHIYDFFDMKGDLQALFAAFQCENIAFISKTHPALHPGKSALITKEGLELGYCGSLHPRIADALDVQDEVLLFELRLDFLNDGAARKYRPISKFPQIRRDLSLLVDEAISIAELEKTVRLAAPVALLKEFHVFDLYCGPGIPEGKKSLAIAIILQDDTKTLIDQEINQVIDAILKKLEADLSITLRD